MNMNSRIKVMNHELYMEYIGKFTFKPHFCLLVFDKKTNLVVDEYYQKFIRIEKGNSNIQNKNKIKINDDESSYRTQYNKLKAYINKYKEYIDEGIDIDFIISCKGGVSRSPALAAAILRYFRLKTNHDADEYTIFNNGIYTPNMHVYNLACRAFGVKCSKKELMDAEAVNLKEWKKIHSEDIAS